MVLHRHSSSPRTRHRHCPLHHHPSLLTNENPPTVTSTTPLYIPLAIALLTPSPFCVTCLSILAFEYCRQRYLCTLVIIDPPFYCIHTSYWYHRIISCVTRLFPRIHNCYLGLCISHKWEQSCDT